MSTLKELDLTSVKVTSKGNEASFVAEPLSPGYGVTIGNSLRRVLIASIEGSAITAVKINNAVHEFTTIDGVAEDVVNIILNLKEVRLKSESNDPVTLVLEVKGPKKVTAGDFKTNPQVVIANPEHEIASLEKGANLKIEVIVNKGRGYVTTESQDTSSLPKGYIAVDAIYTPIRKVHYEIENTRVGQATNFDKVTMDVTTDGTLSPEEAFSQAAGILSEHFGKIAELTQPKTEKIKVEKPKKATVSKQKKK